MPSPPMCPMTTIAAPAPSLDLQRLEHDGHYIQDEFVCTGAPYAYFKAGRACGKTLALCYDAIDYAEEFPGSVQLWTEPSWTQIERNALPALRSLYGPMRGRGIEWTQTPPIEVKLGNGSLVWLAAMDTIDEDRLRGMNLSRLLMDEAAQGRQEYAFQLASACVRDTTRPNQRKFTSTPQGRNWLWRMFSGPDKLPGALTFMAYSRDAEHAGFVPRGWVEERALEYGGWDNPLARQELLAQELEMAGQVHPQFGRDTHCRTAPDGPFKDVLGGIDYGGVSPTALVVAGLGGDGRAYALDEWYKHEATEDELAEARGTLEAKWPRLREWRADPSGKYATEKLNNARGKRVVKASHGNDLKMRVRLVGARLTVRPGGPGCYFDPRCANLIAEIEGLMWKRTRVQGRGEEMLNDQLDPTTPDHAWDAWANILAEWDETRGPIQRTKEPVCVYDRDALG